MELLRRSRQTVRHLTACRQCQSAAWEAFRAAVCLEPCRPSQHNRKGIQRATVNSGRLLRRLCYSRSGKDSGGMAVGVQSRRFGQDAACAGSCALGAKVLSYHVVLA